MKFTSLIRKTLAITAITCLISPIANAQVSRVKAIDLSMTHDVSIVKHKKSQTNPSARFVTINPLDYGTMEVVMQEDFSKFATGSEAEPDLETNVILDFASGECEYPWWNVNPDFTTIPNWGGSNIYPAGGKVYMIESIFEGQGHINTPLLDFTNFDGGIAFLEFKARTSNPSLVQYLLIEAAETNNMSPDWTVLGSNLSPQLTEEWQTYTVMFYGAQATTLFNILPQMEPWWYQDKSEEPSQILFDDFKVYSLNQYVNIPKGLTFKNYSGTEFDLTWDNQEADYYTVDIYAVDLSNNEQFEFATNLKTETNSLHVTEAEDGIEYMFKVTAYKGDKKSFPSLPGFVIDLTDPEFIGTPEFVKNEETGLYAYTSEWNDVPSAQVYDYALLHKRPAVDDCVFAVTKEDFTGLQDADGFTTEWTIENPCYSCYGFLPLKPLKQAGWVGKQVMPFKDFVCIDGWHHIIGKKDAYIASPELDLSKDNGNVHISVKLFGRIGGSWVDPITDEEHPEAQTKAAISLYNYDEATGEFIQAEYVKIDEVTIAWNTFDIDLTKGSKRSFIVISAIEGPEHLYIDDLLITQNYKKGEFLIEPCIYEYWYEYSIIDLELPETSQGLELTEKVCAQKINMVDGQPVFSDFTYRDLSTVGEIPASIQDAAIAKANVSVENGVLRVNNINKEIVNVRTVDGKLIATSYDSLISIPVAENTVYLVSIGKNTVKVSL